jgi:hypothetical protein
LILNKLDILNGAYFFEPAKIEILAELNNKDKKKSEKWFVPDAEYRMLDTG